MKYIIIIFISFIFNIFYRNLFIKLNFIDKINSRSSHKSVSTRTGGAVLFSVIFLYSVYFYLIGVQPYDFSIFIPISVLFVMGIYDDIKGVDYSLKFIFQIIAAKMLVDLGFVIDIFSVFGYEFDFTRLLAQFISIFIFVGLFNAYNFIDGLDGNIHLETIKNLILILVFFDNSDTNIGLIYSILIVMLVTFAFNLKRTPKVFMGDSGSHILPIIIMFFIFQNTLNAEDQNTLKYIFLIFLYPLVDLIRIIILRLYNKKSPFKPDKKHIHHLLNNKINSHFKTSILISSSFLLLQILIFLFLF